jgi:mono/diheme cytochrome c family protein
MKLCWPAVTFLFMAGMGRCPAMEPVEAAAKAEATRTVFQAKVQPLLSKYCFACHGEKKKGDLDLRIYTDDALVKKDAAVFEKLASLLETREMPPENKPQPSAAQRKLIIDWIEADVLGCDCKHPDPGRVTIRRLNREEYNNTVRELTGVSFHPADDFPMDDVGYGFDNIGDVLSLSPLLFEKYMTAAGKIMNAANLNEPPIRTPVKQAGATAKTSASPPKNTEAAREMIANFARRAFRRPVTPDETARLLHIYESVRADGGSFEAGVRLALQAVLVSPNFLFRGELQPEPDNPKAMRPVGDYALASRLSYFLWSDMPDEELFALAAGGKLRNNLEPQVKRMLKDPKAHALVENFADQWLQIRALAAATPDPKTFPQFDDALRNAMQAETELFFEYIMRADRSVLEFLDSDYTFLNARLAKLYGIPGVQGDDLQRVTLKDRERGGLLTQASILTVTSTATRTSPVKRGKWVLENILGTPPPPPLPEVPPLAEGAAAQLTGTLRQRLEQHRADPACASCHARMDPIGFGFENYDGIGAWRAREGEFPIDATGQLLTGETFNGAAEFKRLMLKTRRDQFARCLSEKLLTYALGRGLERYDKCAVDQITANLAKGHYKFSSLVLEIVKSTPFQMTRGEAGK